MIFRKIARASALLLVTATLYPLLVLSLLLLLPLPGIRLRVRNGLFRLWSRLCLRIFGCRLRIEGEVPRAPFFLVCNHLSYVDIPVLSAIVGAYFIAKLEIRGWPALGVLSRTVGTIFVDRELRRDDQRVNEIVGKTLDRGYGIVLFPEGTSSQGYEIMPFKSALLAYPTGQGMPIHSASLSYAVPEAEIPAHLSIAWWGDAPFVGHFVQLLGIRSFEVTVRFSDQVEVGRDRKEVSRRLHERVSEGFVPVVSVEDRAFDPGF